MDLTPEGFFIMRTFLAPPDPRYTVVNKPPKELG
jgi:hypothetical protein